MDNKRSWYFWATDDDRSWGWSNHVYTLGAAFHGYGDSAEVALAEAQAAKRDDYVSYCGGQEQFLDSSGNPEPVKDSLIGIPEDAEVGVTFTIPVELLN